MGDPRRRVHGVPERVAAAISQLGSTATSGRDGVRALAALYGVDPDAAAHQLNRAGRDFSASEEQRKDELAYAVLFPETRGEAEERARTRTATASAARSQVDPYDLLWPGGA